MNAREILTNISIQKYSSKDIFENENSKNQFNKDCIQFLQESGATKKQAEKTVCKIVTENFYSIDNTFKQNLYYIFQKIEEMAFIFKD